MDEETGHDKLTEGKNTFEKRASVCQMVYQAICPCFVSHRFNEEKSNQNLSKSNNIKTSMLDRRTFVTEGKYSLEIQDKKISMQTDDSRDPYTGDSKYHKMKRESSVFQSSHDRYERYNYEDESQFMNKSTIKKWHSYPIYHHKQNEVIMVGTSSSKMLAVIGSARVQPSKESMRKTNRTHHHEKFERSYTNSNVDKFWSKRYYLFQKFDQGISLDEESWSQVTPEAVAEYIAKKIRCEVVLDGFCGAGGDSIKLANTCSRVIANDIDFRKTNCLNNNAKVYGASNIEKVTQNFLHLENIEADVVYLNPPTVPTAATKNSLGSADFQPALDKIVSKAIKLSRNIVMLLPANTNITKLAETIVGEYQGARIPTNTCSIRIQKIFFRSQLRNILVCLGTDVQQDIKLNDELRYIYNLLKDGDRRPFMHRKIVKKIREQYGMVSLLNFVIESLKIEKFIPGIEKFYEFIEERGLLAKEKLHKIMRDQEEENLKYNKMKNQPQKEQERQQYEEKTQVQEEKYITDQERTVSYYSMGSAGFNRISIGLRQSEEGPPDPRDNSCTGSHITKSDIKTKSNNQSLQRTNTIGFSPQNQIPNLLAYKKSEQEDQYKYS